MNIIEVKDLSKKFNDFTAVDDVSFSVKKGEIFAFLGPNGAGKTTTIKMLTTLLRPSGGQILINGFDPVKDQNAARCSFGIVFQDPSLDEELTAYENMHFHAVLYDVPREKRKERIDTLLKFVDLWEWRDKFVKKFSGGMRRHLEIARGLLHRPQILFLDEPTLGLDLQTRRVIWDHIIKMNKEHQTTVFLTTHYIEEAEKVATRAAIIDHGKIIKIGSIDALKRETNTNSLEEVFLALTGREIRAEEINANDRMRIRMGGMRH